MAKVLKLAATVVGAIATAVYYLSPDPATKAAAGAIAFGATAVAAALAVFVPPRPPAAGSRLSFIPDPDPPPMLTS